MAQGRPSMANDAQSRDAIAPMTNDARSNLEESDELDLTDTRVDAEGRHLWIFNNFWKYQLHCFAILHYLNEGDFGGTGFYRHIPSGFENITGDRKPIYLQSAQQFMDTNGQSEQRYFTESTDHYELIHKVDYKPIV